MLNLKKEMGVQDVSASRGARSLLWNLLNQLSIKDKAEEGNFYFYFLLLLSAPGCTKWHGFSLNNVKWGGPIPHPPALQIIPCKYQPLTTHSIALCPHLNPRHSAGFKAGQNKSDNM